MKLTTQMVIEISRKKPIFLEIMYSSYQVRGYTGNHVKLYTYICVLPILYKSHAAAIRVSPI